MNTGRISGFLRRAACLGLIAAIPGAGGCQQYATYPPVEVTGKLQRPAAEPVPTIIATSIQYARDNFVTNKSLPINLPEGVPPSVYDKVFTHLGSGQPLMSPEEEAIHITEIRTRGMNAQVDMTYPRTDGLYQLVTLTLEHSMMTKWHVKSSRRWALRDVEAPKPNYVAAPVHEKAEKPVDTQSTAPPEPQSSQLPAAASDMHESEAQPLPPLIVIPDSPPITVPPREQPREEPSNPMP